MKLPEGFAIARGTTAGVLLISITERTPAGFYWLWNPVTGKIVRSFWGVVATSATEVAVVRNCASTCVVEVVNPASGQRKSLRLHGGGRVNAASFSSDSRYLAFAVSFDDGLVNGSATVLEVASLKTGHLTVVPRTGVSSDALAGFGWPGNDDRLVAELVFSTRTQMAFWKPGTPRAGRHHHRSRPGSRRPRRRLTRLAPATWCEPAGYRCDYVAVSGRCSGGGPAG